MKFYSNTGSGYLEFKQGSRTVLLWFKVLSAVQRDVPEHSRNGFSYRNSPCRSVMRLEIVCTAQCRKGGFREEATQQFDF